MNQTHQIILGKAQVDDVPLFKRKTPLQRSIQWLKRHRDQMFKGDNEVKPISIIITTLAARAYQGESDIESALRKILFHMGIFVSSGSSVVLNPVNPEENFADRWSMSQYSHLNLKENFGRWVIQAQIDFDIISSSDDMSFITEQAVQKFSVRMNVSDLKELLGIAPASVSVITPKVHTISEPTPKPWRMNK